MLAPLVEYQFSVTLLRLDLPARFTVSGENRHLRTWSLREVYFVDPVDSLIILRNYEQTYHLAVVLSVLLLF